MTTGVFDVMSGHLIPLNQAKTIKGVGARSLEGTMQLDFGALGVVQGEV